MKTRKAPTGRMRQELKQLGKLLKRLREEKGFKSQKAFCEKYNLPPIQYWRIESGKANVRYSTLMILAKVHKISVGVLVADAFSLSTSPQY